MSAAPRASLLAAAAEMLDDGRDKAETLADELAQALDALSNAAPLQALGIASAYRHQLDGLSNACVAANALLMAARDVATDEVTEPRAVLIDHAVYYGDNERRMCRACAGATALYTGKDLSGMALHRATLNDVEVWDAEGDLGPFQCECGHVRLSRSPGPDGWPLGTVRESGK